MHDGSRDVARLEPAVRSAMNLRGTTVPPEEGAPGQDRKRPLAADAGPFSIEKYTAGLNQEIEDNFLIKDREKRTVLQRLTAAYGSRYSRDDLVRAIDLANELNYCAVFVQSSHGDGDEGIAELEERVPGFSRGLYAELLGYMSYINR